jgi:hypothetical protein
VHKLDLHAAASYSWSSPPKEVAPTDLRGVKGRCGRRIGRAGAVRRSQVERSVWTLLVEVADVDADVLELAAADDQEPVEALPARC